MHLLKNLYFPPISSLSFQVTSEDPHAILSTHNKFLIDGVVTLDSLKPRALWDSFSKTGVLSNMESMSPSESGQVGGNPKNSLLRNYIYKNIDEIGPISIDMNDKCTYR